MPIVPKDGIQTRAQAEAARHQGEEGRTPAPPQGTTPALQGTTPAPQGTTLAPPQGTMPAPPATAPPATAPPSTATSPDFAMLLAALQRQEEQAREQARRQEEQAREQARRQEETLRELKQTQEEQAREQQELLLKVLNQSAAFGEKVEAIAAHQEKLSTDVDVMKTDMRSLEKRIDGLDTDCADLREDIAKVEKEVVRLKISGARSCALDGTAQYQGPRVKVPSYDVSTSWSAYRKQFELAAKASGWTDEQCLTALSTALRGPALSVLDAMPNEYNYGNLMEAMEARYGERHLEHVFRAQLRDRVQRSSESLQQWALEVEKLVRKAYPSADSTTVNNSIVQAFIDGIKDLEVRSTVRLAHHKTMKEALAHALEVEAVRQEPRTGRVREVVEVVEQARSVGSGRLGPMCYACGERGHIRINCRQRRTIPSNWRQRTGQEREAVPMTDQRQVEEPAQQTQGNE